MTPRKFEILFEFRGNKLFFIFRSLLFNLIKFKLPLALSVELISLFVPCCLHYIFTSLYTMFYSHIHFYDKNALLSIKRKRINTPIIINSLQVTFFLKVPIYNHANARGI